MQLMWRRRLIILGVVVAILLAWLTIFQVETREVEIITATNQDGSTVTVQRDQRPNRGFEGPDATITVTPGETARTQPIQQPADPQQTPPQGPQPPPNPPSGIPFFGIAAILGPILFVIWLLRKMGAVTTSEVNYGVYKGAMPLEMITAEYAHLVRTSKAVEQNPFGKARSDYLHDAGVDDDGRVLLQS